jgi:hypothetical protein
VLDDEPGRRELGELDEGCEVAIEEDECGRFGGKDSLEDELR